MTDRFSDLVEKMMEMTEMTEEEKARFMDAFNNIEELRKIDDISDIDDIDLDFDEIEIEEMDDVQNLLDEIDELPIDDFGGISLNDLDTGDITDYFDSTNDYLYEPEAEEVDVDITGEEVSEQPYHGSTWMEVGDGYEALVDIPEGTTESDIDINVQSSAIVIENPIAESLSIDELPVDVTSVEARITGGVLLLRVE